MGEIYWIMINEFIIYDFHVIFPHRGREGYTITIITKTITNNTNDNTSTSVVIFDYLVVNPPDRVAGENVTCVKDV